MPEVGTKQGSDVKAFATSALTGDVWIVELKAFVQTFFDEIQFGAVKIDHAFAVDDHFHAFVFKTMSSSFISSTNSRIYAIPEQPDVRTPKRRPKPLPRLFKKALTRCAALSLIDIDIDLPQL
uniref:Uncharacterized protein n=1 Tax=Yersinia enterocolitica W22703 TaxID=913028 RepID=F4MUU5_YEREN|nr:unknown protein [Yersinia enterocolitica W22703]